MWGIVPHMGSGVGRSYILCSLKNYDSTSKLLVAIGDVKSYSIHQLKTAHFSFGHLNATCSFGCKH